MHALRKNMKFNKIISALHGMPARTSDEKGVRPSVRLSVGLSVKCVHCDKMEERVQIFYTIRKIVCCIVYRAYSLLRRRMICGGDPFYLKFWVNRPPLE